MGKCLYLRKRGKEAKIFYKQEVITLTISLDFEIKWNQVIKSNFLKKFYTNIE